MLVQFFYDNTFHFVFINEHKDKPGNKEQKNWNDDPFNNAENPFERTFFRRDYFGIFHLLKLRKSKTPITAKGYGI